MAGRNTIFKDVVQGVHIIDFTCAEVGIEHPVGAPASRFIDVGKHPHLAGPLIVECEIARSLQ